ncbi:MAG TPA: chromosome segregation protein SMC [Saprospiraceae bacterium]|nr:chromosome segregation protein SMC [Saprospiraceae bacterium]
MRLEKIELKGFKSFANETVIHFHEDVTGVVGPNGSGKSNIVDAFRWVLGEQKSKDLRLDKMASVIFNGSSKKKESGIAQVSLTFENTKNILPTEYNTVTISRILYRSGESEYRINDVPCRLKDLTSLLLDTGMGSDSYAIIALNMVDDLLNDKDNSRQKMLFQAAGITKYKIRKEETLRKLKSTEEDLERVKDLVFEIESNLKSLEKQAKRAEKYFELKNSYKDSSLRLAILKVSQTKESYKTLNSQIEKEEAKYKEHDERLRKVEVKLEQLKKANLDNEKLLSEKQKNVNDIIYQTRTKENEKNILKERLNFLSLNANTLSETLSNIEYKFQQTQKEVLYYQEESIKEKQIEDHTAQKLMGYEENLKQIRSTHTNLKSSLEEILSKIQLVDKELFELEKQIAINQNQIESIQKETERNKQSIADREAEMTSSVQKLQMLKSNLAQKQKLIDEIENAHTRNRETQDQLQLDIETKTKELADINRTLDAKRNEYKLTQSLIENLEGFPESIKFLSANKEWGKDIPLLSDIIYCKEEYRVVLENYLEPYLNYYVVDTINEALKAVHLLQNSQKGKANFILLESIPKPKANKHYPKDYIPAYDCIEAEDKYHKVFQYLLHNVFIGQNDITEEMLDDEQVTYLSANGTYIRRKYTLSGGSVGLFEGKKIGRKKNLEILEKEIAQKERQGDSLIEKIKNLREKLDSIKKEDLQQKIYVEREDLNKLNQEKVSLEIKVENLNAYKKEVTDKIENADLIIVQTENSIKEFKTQLTIKTKEATLYKQEVNTKDSSFKSVADEMNDASRLYNESNIEFIKQQNKVVAIKRELSFRETQFQDLKFQIEKINKQQKLETEEIQIAEKDILNIDSKLLSLYEEKKLKEQNLTEVEKSFFESRGTLNELEDSLRNIQRDRQNTQILINTLKDQYNDIKFKLAAIGERLQIEFKIGINEIINRDPEDGDNIEELETSVDKIRLKLETFGEVNPLAVEAYNEIKERYDLIKQQEKDILDAKVSLMKTITEIEETATRQYLESFEKVRANFIEVFRSLFTSDDTCDLLLANPENPLESEINIIAKPKGKRPLSINQLSGGEKTLTAIALLFALYLLKPAPFCIFDEVDAPLDDTNIEKFNRIIKKFSKDSQFIIVTHNKATMASVDVIYGVYMPEQGISAVSAVDFRALEHSMVLSSS